LAKLVEKSQLLDNKDLSVIGYGLYVAVMGGCIQVCIEFMQYSKPFLYRGDPNASWLMALYAVGVVCAFTAIVIAVSRIYLVWHERRSFRPISY
jgi:hypothetical protein